MAPALKSMLVPAYKISKAALNSLTVQYALDLEEEGFTIVPISPGVSIPAHDHIPLSNMSILTALAVC